MLAWRPNGSNGTARIPRRNYVVRDIEIGINRMLFIQARRDCFAVSIGLQVLRLSRNVRVGDRRLSDVYCHHELESRKIRDDLMKKGFPE